MVGVEVRAEGERPVSITCHDHAHIYEIAWRSTEAGPVITDLRVTSPDGAPITTDSLKRINTERLARTAAMHDTAEASERARQLRQTMDTASGTTEGHEWIEQFRFTDGVIDAMARHAPPGITVPTSGHAKRGGRPRHSREFLAQVAAWAREAHVEGHSIYPYVAQRASAAGRPARLDTVKVWVRRAKEAGLLDPDELRQPRKTRTDSETYR